MSHVTTVETKLDDKAALKAACKELGLKYSENAVADLGYGNKLKGDVVITLPNGTQMALVWNKAKKCYEVHCDFYGGSIRNLLGGDLRKLKQAHSVQKLTALARRHNYRVQRGKVDAKTGDQVLYLYGG